ncbi:hypothetical protein OIE75_29450 [Streptomyces sp. NBC_01723]|uniref:hypothetical protein n=1 Tax=Streptomyces sp. NBC_01723 TaxID=2975921 RepID=UPI002E317684|nr:hypothetical protein [Streptomyces sp. NBC_01723]
MTELHDHEPKQFYWDAETNHCPHKPIPERNTDAWDQWMTLGHQPYDNGSDHGTLCLSAPAGTACPACSAEHGDMVPWERCEGRDHIRPANGIAPNPEVEHQAIPVWVGSLECLERECEDFFTDDGDEKFDVETCSHVREETACSCQALGSGEYSLGACPALAPSP